MIKKVQVQVWEDSLSEHLAQLCALWLNEKSLDNFSGNN